MIFIPDHVGKTSDARRVLPKNYTIQDVVFNIGRVAWLVNALNTNSLHNLHFGVQDRLHQPQRGEHVYKHLEPMIEVGRFNESTDGRTDGRTDENSLDRSNSPIYHNCG